MILVYTLSLIPMLLITLVIHELGHLAVARILRIKPARFQIGVGWNIINRYSGRTRIGITPETATIGAPAQEMRPGDLVSVYVHREPGAEHYTAAAILPQGEKRCSPEELEKVQQHGRTHMRLTGRIRKATAEQLTLADMAWSLRAIPLMAGVIFPDDPTKSMPEAYNAASWRRQVAITVAGVAANVLMTVTILAMVAMLPIQQPHIQTWSVAGVEAGGPAESAGIVPGDRIVRVQNTIHPTMEELRRRAAKAAQEGRTINLGVTREGRTLEFSLQPDPTDPRLGIHLQPWEERVERPEMTPGAISVRVQVMAGRYTSAIGSMLQKIWNEEGREEAVSGPVMGAYQAAHVVERAGPWGWLLILATLNLAVAATNLVPIPPQDGYRMIAESLQALRKGKPVSPKLERAMFVGGITIVVGVSAYLVTLDILRLMG